MFTMRQAVRTAAPGVGGQALAALSPSL